MEGDWQTPAVRVPGAHVNDTVVSPLIWDRTERDYTTGEWATELESVAALDAHVEVTGLFSIYREVRGYYLQPRIGQEDKTPRIDRILVPKPELIAAGWTLGCVGVECKRSNEKIGRPISQMLDYSRAAWLIKPANDLWIVLRWVFLWPAKATGGPIASVLAQNRLGTLHYDDRNRLAFRTAAQDLALFHDNGSFTLKTPKNGDKAGCR